MESNEGRFYQTLKEKGPLLIGEIKVKSPRDGYLLKNRDPFKVSQKMVNAGAEVISVVTESQHFGGNLEILKRVRKAIDVPILLKDFIKSKKQIREGAASGADAILLISSILSNQKLKELKTYCQKIGVEALVEVHDSSELEFANKIEAKLIGINNRDIKQLEKDSGGVERTERLAPLAREEAMVISESSLQFPQELRKAVKAGVNGLLIGTAILEAESIEEKVKQFVNEIEYGNEA